MPNWCVNELHISHPDPEKMQRLNKAFETDLFEEFVPMPKDLTDDQSGNGLKPDWYHWRLENWGTKWTVSKLDGGNTIHIIDENTSILSFDTAWSPPIEFYERMKEFGYQMKSYFWEPGMGFCGIYTNDSLEEYDQEDDLPEDLDEALSISSWLAECSREFEDEDED